VAANIGVAPLTVKVTGVGGVVVSMLLPPPLLPPQATRHALKHNTTNDWKRDRTGRTSIERIFNQCANLKAIRAFRLHKPLRGIVDINTKIAGNVSYQGPDSSLP